MKIIQLIQKPQRRGAEIFAAQLSEELTKLGHEVLLVSIFSGEAKLPFSGKSIELGRKKKNRFWDFVGWFKLSKIIKEFSADLVQANAADTLKYSVFSKKVFGWNTPLVYRNANQMGDFIKNSVHRKFNEFLLRRVSAIISVSVASQADLELNFNIQGIRSQVIPIGVDLDSIESSLLLPIVIDLPDEFILQIGGLVPEKRPLEMIGIFRKVLETFPNFKLVFLGSGPLQIILENKINDLGLRDKILLIPSQENIFPILTKAKALVMPSAIEGLPAVLLEAMYCKIPVIACNVGGISEIVDSKTGWLIEKENLSSFGKTISNVLSLSQEDIERITENSFKKVILNYSNLKITKDFEKFYKSIKCDEDSLT